MDLLVVLSFSSHLQVISSKQCVNFCLQHRRISTSGPSRGTHDTQLAWPRRTHAEYTAGESRDSGVSHIPPRGNPPPSPPIVRPRGTRKARIGAVSTRYSLAPSHYRYYPSTLTMSLAERHMRALPTSFPDSGPSAQQRKEPPNISSSHTPFLAHGRWRRVDVFSRITHGSPSNYTHLVWKNGDL